MNFVLFVVGLVVFSVFLAFEYLILVNKLVAKKESVRKHEKKLFDWQEEASRREKITKDLLATLLPGSGFEPAKIRFIDETSEPKFFEELLKEVLAQQKNLKNILDLSDKNASLLRSDDFFAESKKIKELLANLGEFFEIRKNLIAVYNKALKKSPVRMFSKMEKIQE